MVQVVYRATKLRGESEVIHRLKDSGVRAGLHTLIGKFGGKAVHEIETVRERIRTKDHRREDLVSKVV